ncbi:MAG: DUF6683 family protein [Armatimonadota bacterium]
MRPIFSVTLALIATILPSSGTRAQIDNGLPGPQPFDMGSLVLSDTLNRMRLENALGTKTGPRKGKGKLSAATIRFLRKYRPNSPDLPENAGKKKTSNVAVTAKKPSLSSITYRSNPQVSEQAREKFLRWAEGQNPQEGRSLRQTFTQFDPVQVWSGLTRPYGFQTGNLADAFASYWALNYAIAKGLPNVDRQKALGLRDQVRVLFANNPAVDKASDALKQQAAENWMLQFVVQQGAYSAATKNGNQTDLQRLKSAAASRFQSGLHLDINKVALTDKGFSTRS